MVNGGRRDPEGRVSDLGEPLAEIRIVAADLFNPSGWTTETTSCVRSESRFIRWAEL